VQILRGPEFSFPRTDLSCTLREGRSEGGEAIQGKRGKAICPRVPTNVPDLKFGKLTIEGEASCHYRLDVADPAASDPHCADAAVSSCQFAVRPAGGSGLLMQTGHQAKA
jgi:hypothetical protein